MRCPSYSQSLYMKRRTGMLRGFSAIRLRIPWVGSASIRSSILTLSGQLQSRFFYDRPEIADHDLEKLQIAGYDKILFAWAGGLELGEPHYYRIQGPTFLMEYDNTQNNANHIHAVWRDFESDFGEDLLKKHYEQVPHGK